MNGLIIVGASYAGVQAAVTAREVGYTGPIKLIGNEPHLPYQRPPLSKGLLLGKTSEEQLMLRGEGFFASRGIDLMLGHAVDGIDRSGRQIKMADGAVHAYDKLVLATGSRARTLDIPGSDLQGVHYLRSLADARALQSELQGASAIVVIGGGFIGLEVASAAMMLGKRVTILESASCLLQRAVCSATADYLLALHESKGTRVVLGAQVTALQGSGGRVVAVSTRDGKIYECDLALVGIGGLANDALAAQCGLPCDNGIVVDEFGQTSDPSILAAGDCTNHPNSFAGRRLRLESVQNALDQARSAGATAAGKPTAYDAVPRFWSDQFEAKLQMVGLSLGHDTSVVRGSPADGRFSVFMYKEGTLVGIDSINRPGDHVAGRKLLGSGMSVPPEQAADLAFDLKGAAAAAGQA